MSSVTHTEVKAAPVKATWITLVLAWVLFLVPVPGAGLFVGWPLNLVAFILAIVVMTRGRTAGGLIPLLCSIIVSPVIYFIGVAIFAATVSKGSYDDYVQRAKAQAAATATASGQGKPIGTDEKQAPAKSVTARKLFADYQANEVSADNAYKGKALAVTGTVDSINKDITDDVYVSLSTSNEFMSVHARGLPKDVAAGLAKGQQITVVCKGAGMIMSSPMLDDCAMK